MQIYPNHELLLKRKRQLKTGAIIFGSLILTGALVLFYFFDIPAIVDDLVRHQGLLSQHREAWDAYYKVEKAISAIYRPQGAKLLETVIAFERNGYSPFLLNDLSKLPDVLDAYYYRFDDDSVKSAKGLVGRKEIDQIRSIPHRTPMMKEGDEPNRKFPAYFHTNYDRNLLHACADLRNPGSPKVVGVVGLAFDYQTFIDSIPKILSETYPSSNPSFEDYLIENGRALGILYDGDTLWWKWDKSTPVTDFDWDSKSWRNSGLVYPISGTGLVAHSRARYSQNLKDDQAAAGLLVRMVQAVALIGFLLTASLIVSLFLLRRRHARNQIALAHLAHAVKTPVARLKLAAETLTEGRVASPEEEQQMLKTVTCECDRLDRAVQNAALSLEKGRLEFDLQPGNLANLVSETVESWKLSFESAGIELKVEQRASPLIKFDRALLPVAFDNLIDNALKHTRIKGRTGLESCPTVTISLTSDDKFAILMIDDSGEGIVKSERSRLFKPFTGSKRDPKSGATGLGLGLALVKRIVEGHKGTVSVADAPGGGARFEVKLPLN